MADNFESSVADIAYSFLQEKAIALIPHLVGFEIVDKNDENTKAIGIFAFKVGDQYLYAPAFFLNGEIKPLELLYLSEKRIFVPLSEKWVNYILKQKPALLGESADIDNKILSAPNLQSFATPPITGKYMSASAKPTKAIDLLSKLEPQVKKAFVEKLKEDKPFLTAVLKNYGLDLVKKSCVLPVEKKAEDTVSDVKIVHDYDGPDTVRGELNPREVEELTKNKVVVKDSRPQERVSKLWDQQYLKKFQNPQKSGIFNVVDVDGSLTTSLVLINPKSFNGLYSSPNATVVELSTMRSVNSKPRCIWVRENLDVEKTVYGEELPSMDRIWDKTVGLTDGKLGGTYILLNKQLQSSVPFRITRIVKDSDGILSYDIRAEDTSYVTQNNETLPDVNRTTGVNRYGNSPMPLGYYGGGNDQETSWNRNENWSSERQSPFDRAKVMISPKKEGNLYMLDDMVIVPQNFSLLPLERKYKEEEKLRLGGPGAVSYNLMRHNINQLSVRHDGSEYIVSLDSYASKPQNKSAALKTLVFTYGVGGKDAIELLKKAEQDKKVLRFIKLAQGLPYGPSAGMGPMSLPIPDPRILPDTGDAAGRQYLEERLMPLPASYPPRQPMGMGENLYTGPSPEYPSTPEMDTQLAMQADQLGQKSVFDHAMLGTLASVSEAQETIRGYVPDLLMAVDKLGRTLYLFWWKNEEFVQSYPISELQTFEHTLRNVFKNLGDLVIDIARKHQTEVI